MYTNIMTLYYHAINCMYIVFCRKMKIVLAIAVFTCLFVMGLAQCASRESELYSCISILSLSDTLNTFCRNCGNSLVGYFQDCTDGTGVDLAQRSKL